MKKENITRLFEKFNEQNVLIIGDVMVDSYLIGNVDRISPEAPVPIVNATNKENRLGGAANVALNIQALGATPYLCSVIGEDQEGINFIELLARQNISNAGIIVDKDRKTTVKTRVIAGDQQLLRIDSEDSSDIKQNLAEQLFSRIEMFVVSKNINGIIFQDYNKGILTPFIIEKTILLANQHNIAVLADPKKKNFNLYKNITLFKPNFRELKEGLNLNISKNNTDKIIEAGEKILSEWNLKFLLLTLSEKGIIICSKEKSYIIPAHIRDITDVSGAGDTVISTAALCLISGMDVYDIAWISNLAGGQVCEKSGVVPVNKQKLFEELIEKY